jgi:hypothetical protein
MPPVTLAAALHDEQVSAGGWEHRAEAGRDVGAQGTVALNATDVALQNFFAGLPASIDDVMVSAGAPHCGPLLEMESAQVRDAVSDHISGCATNHDPVTPTFAASSLIAPR